jgi:hypothetical protein
MKLIISDTSALQPRKPGIRCQVNFAEPAIRPAVIYASPGGRRARYRRSQHQLRDQHYEHASGTATSPREGSV